MRCWILYILVFGLCAGAPAGAPQPDAGPTNFSRDAVETPIRRTGDQITLKSGKVLHGVKIVRRTSLHLVLEILPEIKPLLIPVRQVAAIEYGTLEPRSPRPGPDPGPATAVTGAIETGSDVFNAVKVSPELIEKMGAPFTPDPIDFENQDIVNVLRSISILSRVNITLEPAITQLTQDQRRVTLAVPQETSFDQFLNDILPESAPWLYVSLRFDRLHFAISGPLPDTERPSGDTGTGKEFRGVTAELH